MPAPTRCTVALLTVQTPGVRLVKVTGLPEVPPCAATVKSGSPRTLLLNPSPKLIVCDARPTAKARCTLGAEW